MVVTLSWASISAVAGVIVVIGSAWKVIIEARKALNKPYQELLDKFEHYDKCLASDKERLDSMEEMIKKLSANNEVLSKDNEIELMALRDIINHLRTDNNTGAMQEIEDDIDEHLISRHNVQLV